MADRFIFGVAPIDYGPVLLLMPFRFPLVLMHLMDTLPSGVLERSSGQRGITPAFGYGAPHSSARGTLTLLNNVLLSTHYGVVRLLSHLSLTPPVALVVTYLSGVRGDGELSWVPGKSLWKHALS